MVRLIVVMIFLKLTMKSLNCKLNSLHYHNFEFILKLHNRTTVVIIGTLYERLGRLIHRSSEETIQLLLKLLKNGHSQMRLEVLNTLERMINGLGSNGRHIHREIFKITKTHLCDRAMSVRSAAAKVWFSSNNFQELFDLFLLSVLLV